MEISQNAKKIRPSCTLAITAKAAALRAAGKEVINFSVGEPDFDTPSHIKQAAIRAIEEGFTKYTAASGMPELKDAICKKLEMENHVTYTADQIVVSNGAKHSLMNTFFSILNPGDEVYIPAPYWLSYPEMVRIAGGTPVIVYPENGCTMTKKDWEKVCTPKGKAIVFNSPCNPTGMVYTKQQLEELASFCMQQDLYIVADEIYEKLIYSKNKPAISIASLGEDVKARTILINGVSKSYAMTGWRIGYAAAPLPIAKAMASLQSHMTSNPNSIAQKAALAAITGPQDCIETMKESFCQRRDLLYERLEQMEEFKIWKPEGAFYILADITAVYGKKYKDQSIESAVGFAESLLQGANIAVVPCEDFGMPGHIRFSYATSAETIKKGMDQLQDWLAQLH